MDSFDKLSAARQIIHVDMDAFYASVEQLDNPELLDKPVIVGGNPKARGVVSAASYKARKYGVHSAMPMSTAIRRCPQAVILPVRMARYTEISQQINAIFARYTPQIEPISLDEAFLDVTGSLTIWKTAKKIALLIKTQIRSELGLTASLGIAPNKFLAKLASDLEKPEGFVVITSQNAQTLLDPLPIEKIWGIGRVTSEKLKKHGIFTIANLRQCPQNQLKNLTGNSAQTLIQLASGIDDRPVMLPEKPKSISREKTFPRDISQADRLLAVLLDQVEDVSLRLRRENLKAKTLTLKLRSETFETISRSITLDEPTDLTETLWKNAKTIFHKWHRKFGNTKPLRLIGFAVSQLVDASSIQKRLFEEIKQIKQQKIDQTTDKIKAKYGRNSIKRNY